MPTVTSSPPASCALLLWLGTAARLVLGAVWLVTGASKITDLHTDAPSQAGITATPTVLVNGQEVARSAEALRAAVAAGSSGS